MLSAIRAEVTRPEHNRKDGSCLLKCDPYIPGNISEQYPR